MEDICCK